MDDRAVGGVMIIGARKMRETKKQIEGMWKFYEMAGNSPSVTYSERYLRRFAAKLYGNLEGADLSMPYSHLLFRITPQGTLKAAHLPIYIPRRWAKTQEKNFLRRATQETDKERELESELARIRRKAVIAPLHETGHIIASLSNPHFLAYQYKIAPNDRTMDLSSENFIGAVAETHAELLAYRFFGRENLEFQTDDLRELFDNADKAGLDEPSLKALMAKNPNDLKDIDDIVERSNHHQAPFFLDTLKDIKSEIESGILEVETYYF